MNGIYSQGLILYRNFVVDCNKFVGGLLSEIY